MPEEQKQDEQQESSPALEAAMDKSAQSEQEQQPDTETATPQEAESQEQEQPAAEETQAPLHEHPRFKEVIDEKNKWRTVAEQLLQQRQAQQQPQQPTQDPFAGMTAEEEKFWRAIDLRAEKIAQKQLSQITPMLEAGRAEIARMKVTEFRQSHPDIKSNSPDEIEIAEKINLGYDPDDAYWAVMGPRGIRAAEGKVKQQVKQRIEAKKKANVESVASIPPQSVPKGKRTMAETLDHYLRLAEKGELPSME